MSHLLPILSVSEARAHERGVLGDDPAVIGAAVEAAGLAIADALLVDYMQFSEWPDFPQILILAGKGLNAADAFVAARCLQEHLEGVAITVIHAEPAEALSPIAKAALDALAGEMGDAMRTLSLADGLPMAAASPFCLVIDGVYGHGFRAPLAQPVADLFAAVAGNHGINFRAAIDLPSGLGEPGDPQAFVADFTYVPGVPKAPSFEESLLGNVGRLRFLDVEPFASQPAAVSTFKQLLKPTTFKRIQRLRRAVSDKRTFGHGLILAGSAQMPGAALMATRAAIQAGIGLVTTMTPGGVSMRIASRAPEAMWRPLPTADDGSLVADAVRILGMLAGRASALLIGPGLIMDRTTLFTISRIVRETPLPLILDASALVPDVITAILSRPKVAGKVIVTPHRGEFARLLAASYTGSVEQNLLAFSKRYQVVAILKGSQTLISDGDQLIVACAGGPVLARGGTGDLLSGMLLARFALNPDAPMDAALDAVTWHGAAADALAAERGEIAVSTSELLPFLSPVLRNTQR